MFPPAALSTCPVPLQDVITAPWWSAREYESLGAMLLSCYTAVNYQNRWDHVLGYVVGRHAEIRRWLSVFLLTNVSLRIVTVLAFLAHRVSCLQECPGTPAAKSTPPPMRETVQSDSPNPWGGVRVGELQREATKAPPTSQSSHTCNTCAGAPSPRNKHVLYDTLTYSSLNIGGVDLTANLFCRVLHGFCPLLQVLALQEFRPSQNRHETDMRQALHRGYHLIYSSPTSKDGVALLIHTSLTPKCQAQTVHLPGSLISVPLSLHHDPITLPVRVASLYGPHTMRRKRPCEPALDQLLRENSLIMREFNAVTQEAHTTALKLNLSPWLIARERSGAATDLLLPYSQSFQFTRVPRYGGTKSYID